MKRYWKEILLIGMLIFIVIPLFIAFILSFRFISTDTSNEWIGFWGGYLGSVFGGLITLYVLYRTLKDNRISQFRQEKIAFCNYVAELSGKACAKINERDIYILRYLEPNQEVGGNKEDVYYALLAQNEISEILQILTSHLIAKIGNSEYQYVENLMDKIEKLSSPEIDYELKFKYQEDEIRDIQSKCDVIKRELSEVRDYVVTFIKMNDN